MPTRFREDKTTQAAARLMQLAGGRLAHLKLIKLLYVVDREALRRWGRPITYDRYVSMRHGPVLSRTLDLINGFVPPDQGLYWRSIISERQGYQVELENGPGPTDALSDAEVLLLDEVFAQFGRMDQWQLVEMLHELPEWTDPGDSALPIDLDDILRGAGMNEDEVDAVEEELRGEALAQRLFA